MDPSKQLKFLKEQTENIDDEILVLLKRRFQTQKRIFDVQFKNEMELSTQENDIDTMESISKKAREMDISTTFIHNLYTTILDHSNVLKEDFLNSKKKTK